MKYEFGFKHSEELGYDAVVLADGTQFIITKNDVSFMFPKKKFARIFRTQLKDKTRAFVGVSFSYIEMEALLKGIMLLEKEKKKIKSKRKKVK